MENKYRHGDHICALFENEAEQLVIAASYVAEGLRSGERCYYVGSSHEALERFLDALDDEDIDARAALQSGALVTATKLESHLVDGCFDCERMLRLLNEAVEQALNDGYPGLRTCGDMSWLLDDAPGSSQVVEYEALLNRFFENVRAVGMCQYDRRRLPAGMLDHALATHRSVVVDGRYRSNPFYKPAAIAISRPAQAADLNWKISELRRR